MEFYDYTFKILLLSEPEVDKSVMFPGYLTDIPRPDDRTTIGLEFIVKTLVIDKKNYKLQFWDWIGEERFRFLLPQYCKGANAAVLLYDATRSQTLNNIGEWINIIHQTSGDIPIMLVGIIPDEKSERQVSVEEGKKIAKSRNLNGFIECSDRPGENLEEFFETLARLIKDYHFPQKRDEDLSASNYLMKKKRLDSESDFKSRSKISSPKTTSKPPLPPRPLKPPGNPELSAQGRETYPDQIINSSFLNWMESSSARWIVCPNCKRKFSKEDFNTHSCMGDGNSPLGGEIRPSVSAGANIDPKLKSEVQSFLEWIKDSEGLSGYITYYLQQNNPTIISELSKIYAELRKVFGV